MLPLNLFLANPMPIIPYYVFNYSLVDLSSTKLIMIGRFVCFYLHVRPNMAKRIGQILSIVPNAADKNLCAEVLILGRSTN